MRHEALVGVGAGVGDGVQRAGVLDDAADVVERHFGQTGVYIGFWEHWGVKRVYLHRVLGIPKVFLSLIHMVHVNNG